MSTYSGTSISLEDLEYVNGRRKYIKVRGQPINLTGGTVAAVTTYFYRVLATGARGSTTSLGSIPANSVVEGISTS